MAYFIVKKTPKKGVTEIKTVGGPYSTYEIAWNKRTKLAIKDLGSKFEVYKG